MMRLILLIAAIAVVWFAYTNLGKPANLDGTIQNGTSAIKTEKTINNVINRREGMAQEAQEAAGE